MLKGTQKMRRICIITIVGLLVMSVIGGCSNAKDKDELAS